MGDITTKTLAEIYRTQGDLQKAYEIYKVLSEKYPSDSEIQTRLNELSQQLNFPPSSDQSIPRSREEKIRFLEEWLTHIRERKKQ